jgi:hypothetical protein
MEYQFENVQQYGQKVYWEYVYEIRYRRIVFWGQLWLGVGFLDIYTALTRDPLRWISAAVFLALAVFQFLRPYFKEKKVRENGGSLFRRVCFGPSIRVETPDTVVMVEYSQIKKVVFRKYGCYLRLDDDNYVSIDPNGFTKGTFEEFSTFLREKLPTK